MKITKRVIAYLCIGIIILFLFETIRDWDGTKKAFYDGMNSSPKVDQEK
jgi:hypothetical protein